MLVVRENRLKLKYNADQGSLAKLSIIFVLAFKINYFKKKLLYFIFKRFIFSENKTMSSRIGKKNVNSPSTTTNSSRKLKFNIFDYNYA